MKKMVYATRNLKNVHVKQQNCDAIISTFLTQMQELGRIGGNSQEIVDPIERSGISQGNQVPFFSYQFGRK